MRSMNLTYHKTGRRFIFDFLLARACVVTLKQHLFDAIRDRQEGFRAMVACPGLYPLGNKPWSQNLVQAVAPEVNPIQ